MPLLVLSLYKVKEGKQELLTGNSLRISRLVYDPTHSQVSHQFEANIEFVVFQLSFLDALSVT